MADTDALGNAGDVVSAGSSLEKRRSSSEGVFVGRSDGSCEVACRSRDEGDAKDDERDWSSEVDLHAMPVLDCNRHRRCSAYLSTGTGNHYEDVDLVEEVYRGRSENLVDTAYFS